MIRTKRFTPDDADFINAAPNTKEDIIYNYGLKEFGFVTIFKDKNILGIGGVKCLHRFASEFYFTPDVVNIKKYNKSLHREIKRLISEFIKNSKQKRYQIWVDDGFPHKEKWAKVLGFTEEAKIKSIGPEGQDQYLYSRLENV